MKVIKSQILSGNDDQFRNNIRVSIYAADNSTSLEDSTATVSYSIDVEYRSFGIKGVTVIPVSISPISILDEDGNLLKEIQLDASKVKTDINRGSGAYIQELNLYLDLNLNPDYSRSYFDVISF